MATVTSPTLPSLLARHSPLADPAAQAALLGQLALAREFPHTTFFAGKVIFQRERWYDRLLHNETAFAIQKHLQWEGKTMVILPVTVR